MSSPIEFMSHTAIQHAKNPTLYGVGLAIVVVTGISVIINAIRNLFFSPLASFPGPKICAVSRIPQLVVTMCGKQLDWLQYLHNQYGGVVRIAPDTLTYTDERAWTDICGASKYAKDGMAKETKLAALIGGENLNPEPGKPRRQQAHGVMRSAMLPTFKASNLSKMEGVVQSHISEYLTALDSQTSVAGSVDIKDANCFLVCNLFFDIVLGESLHLFKSAEYRPWVHSFDRFSRAVTILAVLNRFPILHQALLFAVQRWGGGERESFMKPIFDRFDARVALKESRNDFLEILLEGDGKKNGMSVDQLREFAPFLVIGGCDTMPTLMAGFYYFLAENAEVHERVVNEIRGNFESEEDITMDRIANSAHDMPYFEACVQEAFRCYSPGGTGTDREVPPSGAEIAGRWVPGGTIVVMLHQPTFASTENFTLPEKFAPERWLDSRPQDFENDRRAAMKPFGVGPQACPGQE